MDEQPMKAVYWIATLAASIVIITVFLNQYLSNKWMAHVKEERALTKAWQERAEHSEDQLYVLKRRYRLLLSERGEE